MRPTGLLPLLLLLPALLAGCVGQDEPLEASATGPADVVGTDVDESPAPPPQEPAPEEPPASEPPEAEETGDDEEPLDDGADEDATPPPTREVELQYAGTLSTGADVCLAAGQPGFQCFGMTGASSETAPAEEVEGALHAYRVEVTWENPLPIPLTVSVETCGDDGCATASATGTSPLVIDVEDAGLARHPSIRVQAASWGTETGWVTPSVEQEYTVTARFIVS